MDMWKYYAITHADHVVCNPTAVDRLDELIGLLDPGPEPRFLDLGSGKGEFVVRTAERFGGPEGAGVAGVAIDLSPYAVNDLRARTAARVPQARIEILEMDAGLYHAEPESFDVGSCLGASWVHGGYRPTLRALAGAVRPGGQVIVGEPFWKHEPEADYLAWSGMRREDFGTHAGNVEAGVAEGLIPWLALVSREEDWDRYETLQWRAAARYANAHPDDPDVVDLVARVDRSRHEYLTWGRETLGWAMYVFGVPRGAVSRDG